MENFFKKCSGNMVRFAGDVADDVELAEKWRILCPKKNIVLINTCLKLMEENPNRNSQINWC